MASKPNLLFIFTDQQRADTMRCYGNDTIQTPNLNALADASFVFENAYVSAPVCTPSRATILTGLYPQNHGAIANNVPLDPSHPTIAEMLPEEYECAYFGKWHLGDEVVPQRGFGRWLSIEDDYRQYYSKPEHLSKLSDYHHFLVESGFEPDAESYGERVFSRPMAARLPVEYTKASFLGFKVAEFLNEERDRPFALYVNFLEPHDPYDGPFNDLYSRDELNTGPAFARKPSDQASLRHRLRADFYSNQVMDGIDLSTEEGMREVRARYWGNVTLMDKAVGVMLEALETSGHANDTVVVFTSEHGDMLGDHGMVRKMMMYEEAIKVPLLVRVPWLSTSGELVEGRVHHVDLIPTLLDLLGVSAPGHLDGTSRVPVLSGEATLADNDVVVEWNEPPGRRYAEHKMTVPAEEEQQLSGQPWRTIISSAGWKLNLNVEDRCELFDLNDDPHELRNLYYTLEQSEQVRDLKARVRRWQKRTGDEAPLPD